jgi:hypothetical protein
MMAPRTRPALALTLALACAAALGASKQRMLTGDSPEARVFVDAQNAVRAGVRKPPGYAGAWAPIPPLAWSDDVAATAQAWAEHLRDDNKCKLLHSDTDYGENLAFGKDLDVEDAVAMWAKESEHYRYSPVYEFEIPTGHYTQMVWRRTTQVGCGIARCGSTVVMVCNYSPHGNVIGRAPY